MCRMKTKAVANNAENILCGISSLQPHNGVSFSLARPVGSFAWRTMLSGSSHACCMTACAVSPKRTTSKLWWISSASGTDSKDSDLVSDELLELLENLHLYGVVCQLCVMKLASPSGSPAEAPERRRDDEASPSKSSSERRGE